MAALHLLGPYLEDFSASATADDEFAMTVMRRHGVPDELATALGWWEARSAPSDPVAR